MKKVSQINENFDILKRGVCLTARKPLQLAVCELQFWNDHKALRHFELEQAAGRYVAEGG